MPQFVYTILQFFSAVFVFIFFLITIAAFQRLFARVFRFKYSAETYLISLLILYFIIGFSTYNVTSKRIGAVCCDDFESISNGSGACSDHGGISYWKIKYTYEEFEEPLNTIHKIFYFWYALNEDHVEADYRGCKEEDEYIDRRG